MLPAAGVAAVAPVAAPVVHVHHLLLYAPLGDAISAAACAGADARLGRWLWRPSKSWPGRRPPGRPRV